MNKILVIGCPGAGKSYLSRALKEKLNIEVIHLDCVYWLPNWVPIDNDLFDERLKEIFKKDKWIMDGNYNRTMDMRMNEADTIFFLDFETNFCLEQVYKRSGTKRDDLPSYLDNEVVDDAFRNYILNFNSVERIKILNLLDKYKNKNIFIFKNRDEVNEYINIG